MKRRKTIARILGMTTILALSINVALLAMPAWILDLIAPAAIAASSTGNEPEANGIVEGDVLKLAKAGEINKPTGPVETEPPEKKGDGDGGEDSDDAEEADDGEDGGHDDDAEIDDSEADDKQDKEDGEDQEDGEENGGGEETEEGATGEPDAAAGGKTEAEGAGPARQDELMFRRIVLATESMEPENAAALLIELAESDQDAVVRTLLAMNPRKAGGVLDAMSLKDTSTTARLTKEMIRRTTR